MIVAKMNMKRMPETCKKCSATYSEDGQRVCSLTNYICPTEKAPSGNERYIMPNWCPLLDIELTENGD